MATTTDFPGNCRTNTYLLNDFGELAYIVCTLSPQAPTASGAQSPGTDGNLARLRHAEAEFRKASIMAVIDLDAYQLFTFYKKVDVLKDQKTLLKKFSDTLRRNSCVIAYKAAARVPDIFKPENARLHRLLVLAILASIKVEPIGERKILKLGYRYHLIEPNADDGLDSALPERWSLVLTNLQILNTGQVTVTITNNNEISLEPLSEISARDVTKPVVLAPSGHLGIQTGIDSGLEQLDVVPCEYLQTEQAQSLWRAGVIAWLKTTADIDIDEHTASWQEVLLPIHVQPQVGQAHAAVEEAQVQLRPKLSFKPILWPSHLCFVEAASSTEKPSMTRGTTDPFLFIAEWIHNAPERDRMVQQEMNNQPDEDSALSTEDEPFDSSEPFRSFGLPSFPASQMVYPTPPDMPMTHTTPGVSSMDGYATTPVAPFRSSGDASYGRQDVEMPDVRSTQNIGVGSGFYDEDLFEEMPEGTFDTGTNEHEPNWDFFDRPDAFEDLAGAQAASHDAEVGGGSPRELQTQGVVDVGAARSHPEDSRSSPQPRSAISIYTMLEAGSPSSQKAVDLSSKILCSLEDRKEQLLGREVTAHPIPETVELVTASNDGKYLRRGSFWFDPSVKARHPNQKANLRMRHTTSTLSSFSGSDSEDGFSSQAVTPNADAMETIPIESVPAWHSYKAESPSEPNATHKEDTLVVDEDVRGTLDLLKMRATGLLMEQLFMSKQLTGDKIAMNTEEQSLILAQIFVVQFTQASLLHHTTAASMDREPQRILNDFTVDLGLISDTKETALVADMVGISTTINGRSLPGQIYQLPEDFVALKRTNKPMIASPSIVPFWDTLALQPHCEPKNVQGFCLYTTDSGSEEACAHFLERLTDSYNSCGLGTHRRGRLDGITSNGVISMTPDPLAMARKIAEALMRSPELSGVVVIYLLAKYPDARSYALCCRNFLALFAFHQKISANQASSADLVLQIIPASFVSSSEALVVPSQMKYNSLAFEVFSRVSANVTVAGAFEYPLLLAQKESDVKFNLDPQTESPLLRSAKVLHLAYSVSNSHRWVVAAWSDTRGSKALSMTYHLRDSVEMKARSWESIVKDIWEVSHELMKQQRGKWKLVVARSGVFDAMDLNAWTHVINGDRNSKCETLLVSVERQSSLRSPDEKHMTGTILHTSNNQHMSSGTPVSTPQAVNVHSPETLIPATPTPSGSAALGAPTPPEHGFDTAIEADLSLTNPASDTWAVVLSFGVSQSRNMLDVRQAIISGYLIRRGQASNEECPSMLGIHLVQAPGQSLPAIFSHREQWLEDILKQYRSLTTLAMLRGAVNAKVPILPWHVQTAIRGADALDTVL